MPPPVTAIEAPTGPGAGDPVRDREPSVRARVLVVDDVAENLRLLGRALAPEHEVMAATSGAEAVRLAEARPPDLILLDVEIPDLHGYEVFRCLQASPRTRGIPVIFVTARSDEEDEIEGLRMGAVDYITKPFREAIVRARVRTHVELKRYRDLLHDRSYVDGLTGIPNRRRFDEYLASTWSAAAAAAAPVALLLADVDGFKSYNDHLGHLAGDECLRRVATALAAGVRRNVDLMARYGGEEFACVMPDADQGMAVAAGERLRAAVADLDIPHPAAPAAPVVTVSIGTASLAPAGDLAADGLVEAADRALFRAKKEGRNRVHAG